MTDQVDRSARVLTNGQPVTDDALEINPATGQQKAYVVLSAEERAKGFVRPVRTSYVHVGIRPKLPVRDLTEDEKALYADVGYIQFEEYPECNCKPTGPGTMGHAETCPRRHGLGRFWTKADLESGCGVLTTMGQAIAETYARDPKFYGATFCTGCRKHLPVEEFVWDGTDARLGS